MMTARVARFDPLSPLEREMAEAYFGLPFAGVRLLAALGVPMGFIGQLSGAMAIGRARVAIEADGTWRPDGGDGTAVEARLIIAVHEDGELVDLVAVSSADPDSWALRTGAGWVLGHDALQDVASGPPGGRLRVFGNPIEWLKHECAGVCVLDWGRKALAELRWLGSGAVLECDSEAARDALVNALRWGGLPQVVSAEDDARGREAA